MKHALKKFRHWKLGQPFRRNGQIVGILTGLKVTTVGVIAIVTGGKERRLYVLESHPHT